MRRFSYCILLFNIFFSSLLTSCEKDKKGIEIPFEQDSLIEIRHFDIFHIHQTKVRGRAIIISPGNYDVSERGVCWSEFKNPTIFDNITMYGAGTGSFTTMITGLSSNTTYYARAYATNNRGTVYSEEKSFTTACKDIDDFEDCKGTFTDERDGMEYGWVKIGTQVWMSENLAYLPSVNPPNESSFNSPYYYVFDYYGKEVAEAKATYYYSLYGVYYNWMAVMLGQTSSNANPSGVKGVCPAGWHVPSHAEWITLKDYVSRDGHFGDEGIVLKTTTGWVDESGNGTDGYGFSGLPGGGRNEEKGGSFGSIGLNSHWWTSTDGSSPNAWMWDITIDFKPHSNIGSFYTNKNFAFAVRCVRD
ncbi:MAG: hypothetical protein A2X05_05930 [Bacteroidetes bacterium GWE2_41_25]|nr:MAG: hypothetical protein A2X03_13585 [Bacteroidetes bacterium GWA2_40_15]OFX95887.1 MAG: hypothetical protein A2X06_01245 [Bacteroidetes bacterium GWC2_40_22]OFY07352.1 MAG: hypothetical protein A2X05_05930 [Bacteroidetes bacterium GWE2_41_25]OFY59588.1 MAG: hypothetical protein A2X04_14555 [Bacteroidetes bacterium GWF2_41_9]HBH85230.1 hypothetical protein [Bacteroidales bacterium]